MKTWMRCSVGLGQFSAEYAVVVRSYNGQKFSLFVPKDLVRCEQSIAVNQSADGWISVTLMREENGLLLVRLPRQTLENGRFLTVSASELAYTATTG